MLKKIYFCFFSCMLILSIVSCGYDTRNWPKIELNFTSDEVKEVTINYLEHKNNDLEVIEDQLIFTDSETISNVYLQLTNIPYRESIESSLFSYYRVRVEVILIYGQDSNEHIITYYEKGIATGKVVLQNGEIHFVPGCFVCVIYEQYKEPIKNENNYEKDGAQKYL